MQSGSRLFVLCLSLLLSACATAPLLPPVSNPPSQASLQPVVIEGRPVIAFVLGSGAARGFAHVGVLNILDAHGIEADIVVGTSAGSVVGALYSGGVRGQALMDAAQQLDMDELTDWTFPNRGVVRGEQLQLYINQLLNYRPIELLPTKFVVVVTDLENGKLVAFNRGDTGMAVRASSSIPGILQPVTIGTREYVDGGLVSQVPVRIARELGADIVIAIDVSRAPLSSEQLGTTLAVMQQAIIIMSQIIAKTEVEEADIIIRPKVENMAGNEFELRDQALAAGEAAAHVVINEIKAAIATSARTR